MKTFRTVLFWTHLVAGLIAGLVIGIMCFTGTVLAFEQEIVAWAERDARRVTAPAPDAARLPLAGLQRNAARGAAGLSPYEPHPRTRPGRRRHLHRRAQTSSLYANPYTGEARKPRLDDCARLHASHDRLAPLPRSAGDHRPPASSSTASATSPSLSSPLSGLYIWMPRTWSWRGVKAIALFNFKSTGKARDFNWHNVIGLWSAPILIVLTLTAVPISFRWGGNLIYTLVGEEVPAQPGPGAAPSAAPAVEIKRPSPDARPLGYDVVVANVQKDFPKWTQITLRSGGLQRGGPRGGNAATSPTAATPAATPPAAATEPRRERGSGESRAAPQPLTVIIREAGSWPRTATTTLTLNPFTGETLTKAGYADLSTARQVRSWTRFLHTGQALGWGGQFVAGLACLGGCFLVYTGFALSWRRFFPNRKSVPEPIPAS
jgi:uncharacterized iron-regulated membrane protein